MKNYKFLSIIFLLMIFGCSENDEMPDQTMTSPSFSKLTAGNDVVFTITSEMTMGSQVRPMPGNLDCVSEVENQLRFKKSKDCLFYMMVKEDGSIDADIAMTDFGKNTPYPKNMVGCPKYEEAYLMDRIEVRNGISTIFNNAGEVITTIFQKEGEDEYYLSIIENIKNNIEASITREEWDIIEQAMLNTGYQIIDRGDNSKNLTFGVTRTDGGRSEITINKELGVFSGNRHYNSDGEVTSASKTILNDDVSDKWEERVKSQIFIVPYESPFVECKMVIVKSVDYLSFDVQHQ